ncbi:hypothetical protein FHW36_105456 [Chitinophaga polysaccharea]|uniref:Uncharacterized protein n=1 Tax=Chitinophaga polysaccharea TaxID=1293035 RepID=A0A561PPH7_9BACT|nr:hypothetical protein FHW36_105456 [Chitinophaga polysaccharea]
MIHMAHVFMLKDILFPVSLQVLRTLHIHPNCLDQPLHILHYFTIYVKISIFF